MNFTELLTNAKEGDEGSILKIMEMYRPLLTKNSVVNGVFDEDLFQELHCTLLTCIGKFNMDGE